MILITGGAWQGKLEFAMKLMGIQEKEGAVADGRTDSYEAAVRHPIVCNLQDYIKRLLQDDKSVEEFLADLETKNPEVVVVTNEVGCGIVPMEKEERIWREESGRASIRLAADSGTVYRLVCGIGKKIKG